MRPRPVTRHGGTLLIVMAAAMSLLVAGCGQRGPAPAAAPPAGPSVLTSATSQAVARSALGVTPVQSRLFSSNVPVDGTPAWTVDFGNEVPTEQQLSALVLSMARLMADEPVVVVTGAWIDPRSSTRVSDTDLSGSVPTSSPAARVGLYRDRIGATVYWNRSASRIDLRPSEKVLEPHSVAVGQSGQSTAFAPRGLALSNTGESPEDWHFITDVPTATVEAWASGKTPIDLAIDPEW